MTPKSNVSAGVIEHGTLQTRCLSSRRTFANKISKLTQVGVTAFHRFVQRETVFFHTEEERNLVRRFWLMIQQL